MLLSGASRWHTSDIIGTPRGRLHHSFKLLVYTLAVSSGNGYHWGPGHGWWGFRGKRVDGRGRTVQIDEPDDARREYVRYMAHLKAALKAAGDLEKERIDERNENMAG